MKDIPVLTAEEKEVYDEYFGKCIDNHTKEQQAKLEAMAEVVKFRKKQKKKQQPHFERIGSFVITATDWIIKGLLAAGDFSMFYGDSGTFKSFVLICLAACVAIGVDFFRLPICKRGTVFYVAAEGQGGLIRRFMAWAQHFGHSLKDAPLFRFIGALNLIEGIAYLIGAIEQTLSEGAPQPCLVVIDTLSQGLGGDDSDTKDSAEGLAAINKLREKYPAMAIILVHHTGHAEKKRARGAYLWRAALDTSFRLERAYPNNPDDRTIVLIQDKAKETEPLKPIALSPKRIELMKADGSPLVDEDGEKETSLILERVPYIPGSNGIGTNQQKIMELLKEVPSNSMPYEGLLEAFKAASGAQKSAFTAAINGLQDKGILSQIAGIFYIEGGEK
jgi:hypothetical protein